MLKFIANPKAALCGLGWILGAGFVGGCGLLGWGYAQLQDFRLYRHRIAVLPPGTEPIKLLHISDLHMLPSQRRKQQWVAQLAELEPDLVVNTGDNLGQRDAVPAVLRALDPLLQLPGIFVFGTNDYFAPRPVNPLRYLTGKRRKVSREELPWQDLRAAFIERGWMDATHARLEFKVGRDIFGGPEPVKVAVVGTDDPHHDLDNYELVAGPPNPASELRLGVVHAPEPRVLEKMAHDGYALLLSGHTHGGQVCLPGQRAIVTNCGIDRARAAGLSNFAGAWLHVSGGLGTSKYVPFRIFCPPSATLLTLVPRGEE